MINEPKYISLAFARSDPENSVLRLIYALFPHWESGLGKVEFRQLTEGKTNMILKVTNKIPTYSEEETDKDAVLLRIYGGGTELLTDREREWKSHCLLARFNLAPQLLARFQNGLIYRFVPGSVCNPADIGKENIWRGVARKLAEWHVVPIDEVSGKGDTVYTIWDLAGRWISALPTATPEESLRKTTLNGELKWLINELSDIKGLNSKSLVLGHCDLLSANVILEPQKQEERNSNVESVSFIDYEYALPCPAAFDISNHFAEWVGYECDYSLLPTKVTRRAFIREYVCSFRDHMKRTVGEPQRELQEGEVEEDVEHLFHEVDRFRGVPGFFWAICAFIQALDPQTEFDYAAYGHTRLAEYWAWKAALEGNADVDQGKKVSMLRERRWAQEE